MKQCVSCGGEGHTYLECTKIPFFGLVAGAFGLNSEPFMYITEEELIDNIKDNNEKVQPSRTLTDL